MAPGLQYPPDMKINTDIVAGVCVLIGGLAFTVWRAWSWFCHDLKNACSGWRTG